MKLSGGVTGPVRMGHPPHADEPVPPKDPVLLFYTHRPAKLNTMPPGEPETSAEGPPDDTAGLPPEPSAAALAETPTLDHAAIAVRSFDDVVPLLEQLSGAPATRPERVESQGVEICFVGNVELIRPLGPDNGVARFLDRRGPGLHHIAYRVPDVERAMKLLAAQGCRFTSEAPMTGARGHRIAFMHPRTAGGVLVELVERD